MPQRVALVAVPMASRPRARPCPCSNTSSGSGGTQITAILRELGSAEESRGCLAEELASSVVCLCVRKDLRQLVGLDQ